MLRGLKRGRHTPPCVEELEMQKPVLIVLFVVSAIALTSAQSKRVSITFAPEKDNQGFNAAAEEYRRIWADEGEHIIRTMEQVTRLTFPEKNVKKGTLVTHEQRGTVHEVQ
jgi:hypothetical protein